MPRGYLGICRSKDPEMGVPGGFKGQQIPQCGYSGVSEGKTQPVRLVR